MATTNGNRARFALCSVSLAAMAVTGFAPAAWADAEPAQAPAAEDEQASGLSEIIVTARKVSENLQNVPVTVTAFSGKDLQAQGALKVSDIARFTPGFTALQSPSNPTSLTLSMRGQVQNDNLATLEPSTGTYLDGVYVARAYGLNADLVDVGSIQVLKGPQGTLFGRNTSAGAILIETNKPRLDALSGELRVGYGRYNELSGSAVVNVPVIQDQLGLRGAFQIRKRDGYITDSNSGAKYNNIDNITGRIKALWQPTSDFSVLASAEWFRYQSNGPARQVRYVTGTALTYQGIASGAMPGLAAIAPANVAAALNQAPQPPVSQIGQINTDPGSVWLNDAPRTDVKTKTYSLTSQYDSGIGTIKAIGGYRQVISTSNIDLDGSPYLLLQTTGYQKLHQWSGELQLTGKTANNKLEYAAGVTYFTEAGNDRSTSNNAIGFVTFLAYSGALAPAGVPAGTFVPNTTGQFSGDIDNKSFGIYGQATYRITDKLSFTGGLRWSNDKKTLLTHNGSALFNTNVYIACNLPTITTVANNNCAAGRADTFKKLSYTAGIDYKITEDVMVYAKAGRGFRSGGENLRANGDPATFNPFKPEINDEQELGIKTQFFDRRVRLNVAAYHNIVSNAQRSLLLAVPNSTSLLTVLYNAEKQETFGVEADLAVAITPNLTLTAGGALTDPTYKSFTQPTAFGSSVLVDHSGDGFIAIPRQTFNVAGDYRRDVGLGQFHARVDFTWSAKYLSAPDLFTYAGTTITPNSAAAIDSFTTPAAGILGANVGLDLDNGLSVWVWGKNLTNNRDYTNSLYIGSLGVTTGTRREPATYGVGASFKF